MSTIITVSGSPAIPDESIMFPSGQIAQGEPGSNLYAFLASADASFGFNLTSHRLDMEFIPLERNESIYHGASGQLPAIGTFLEINIKEFYFNGRVVHSDYSNSDAGTIVKVSLEDERKTLEKIKIHTEDLGSSNLSGVVSVGRAYRILHGLRDEDANVVDALVFEYNKIHSYGATYVEILEAIQLAIDEGVIDFSISKLPTLAQIEANIGGTAESLRFKFNMASLDEAITTILQDTAYDWYWNMTASEINLVNKKTTFNIEENNLITLINNATGYSDISEGTERLSFGQDIISESTRFRLLGGRQQGFINSTLLSSIDGIDTSELDGNIVFTPAWGNINVGFYDADGYYRTYIPSDKELQMALAGIEHWTYFKIYQETEFDLPEDAGSIAAKHETFESRFDPLQTLSDLAGNDTENSIRIISNRRDEQHNWVIDFYNRILNHAQRHFGRSYICEDVIFNETSGLFQPVDSAWCNIENQIEGQDIGVSGSPGPFTEDYQINSTYGPISPFLTDDYKVSAHCVMPASTVYGAQGDQAPAGFTDWTEDAPPFNPDGDGKHYIPCSIYVVGGRVINPRSDDLYNFEDYPDGTLWVQLPLIAGLMKQDGVLANLATLIELSLKVESEGLYDSVDPTMLIEPYSSLSGVAIPIEARIRYGQSFPDPWVLGTEHYLKGESIEVDDAFVPWNFFPIGISTSLEIMTNRAIRNIQGKVVDHVYSRYAEITQLGFPLLSFDTFADQNENGDGLYGSRTHGVTDMNFSLGVDGYYTTYKIASYFGEFGREAPLGERSRAFLDGIIHPIDFTTLNLINQIPSQPGPSVNTNINNFYFPGGSDKKQAVKVTISAIDRVFTLDYSSDPSSYEGPERYRGITETGSYEKPPDYNGDDDFKYGAICVDGFLSIGDQALYHNDEFETDSGVVYYRYFTGGRPLSSASVVKIIQQNASDSSKYDVVFEGNGIKENPTDNEKRALLGLPTLGSGIVTVGSTTILCSSDDSDQINPGYDSTGIYLYSSSAGGSIPVQITALTNPGTSAAKATVIRINSSLSPGVGEAETTNVVPFPFPAYALVGDQGLLCTSSDTQNLVFIPRLALKGN
jgi:hypothetical protein